MSYLVLSFHSTRGRWKKDLFWIFTQAFSR